MLKVSASFSTSCLAKRIVPCRSADIARLKVYRRSRSCLALQCVANAPVLAAVESRLAIKRSRQEGEQRDPVLRVRDSERPDRRQEEEVEQERGQ